MEKSCGTHKVPQMPHVLQQQNQFLWGGGVAKRLSFPQIMHLTLDLTSDSFFVPSKPLNCTCDLLLL